VQFRSLPGSLLRVVSCSRHQQQQLLLLLLLLPLSLSLALLLNSSHCLIQS
jgi:hypothetical protein